MIDNGAYPVYAVKFPALTFNCQLTQLPNLSDVICVTYPSFLKPTSTRPHLPLKITSAKRTHSRTLRTRADKFCPSSWTKRDKEVVELDWAKLFYYKLVSNASKKWSVPAKINLVVTKTTKMVTGNQRRHFELTAYKERGTLSRESLKCSDNGQGC